MRIKTVGLYGGLAVAAYFILVLESVTMGLCFHFGIYYADGTDNNRFRTLTKLDDAAMVYSWFGFIGYLMGVPCLCAALHTKHRNYLVPYLIWRVIFVVASVGFGITLGVFNEELAAQESQTAIGAKASVGREMVRMGQFLPPIVVECVLGVVFCVVVWIIFGRLGTTASPTRPKETRSSTRKYKVTPPSENQEMYGPPASVIPMEYYRTYPHYQSWNPWYMYQGF